MKILYFASIRDWLKCDQEQVEIENPITINDFIRIHLNPRLNGKKIDNFLFAVNEELVDKSFKLSDDDTLAILPPLSGGNL
ncbi:MAG: MoaD/ThiS family protein [Nitrospinota bacterium]